MSKAQAALEFITTALGKGLTVSISTPLRVTTVNNKTVKQWEKAGLPLFKIDGEGNLRIGSGKNYNIICTKSTCLTRISAQ
jgi:hypothetical protein